MQYVVLLVTKFQNFLVLKVFMSPYIPWKISTYYLGLGLSELMLKKQR